MSAFVKKKSVAVDTNEEVKQTPKTNKSQDSDCETEHNDDDDDEPKDEEEDRILIL